MESGAGRDFGKYLTVKRQFFFSMKNIILLL